MATVAKFVVDDGWPRLDRYLAANLTDMSRTRIQELIRAGNVSVDGETALKVKIELLGGESISISIPDHKPTGDLLPQPMDLDILFEDDAIAVVNKAAGMITHPGAGAPDGTLANGLAAWFSELSPTGGPLRPGIVHRLDKDTSGVMVVAKTEKAHTNLARQFEERGVSKKYRAIVWGTPPRAGHIDEPIIRHPQNRIAFTVGEGGRTAATGFEVIDQYAYFAHVELSPKTGRTHQIRVHLRHIGHPIFGDNTYGGVKSRGAISQEKHTLVAALSKQSNRHLLHAHTLSFAHPATAESVTYTAPLPDDFLSAIDLLKAEHGRK